MIEHTPSPLPAVDPDFDVRILEWGPDPSERRPMSAHAEQAARKANEVGRGAEQSSERLLLLFVLLLIAALASGWLLWLVH